MRPIQSIHYCADRPFFWTQGAVPPGSRLLWCGLVYRLTPEATIFREMQARFKAFLESPDVFGLYLAPGFHVKKGLVLKFDVCSAPQIPFLRSCLDNQKHDSKGALVLTNFVSYHARYHALTSLHSITPSY